MKKILCLCVALFVASTVVGCGGSSAPSTTKSTSTTTTTTPTK